MDSLQGIVKVIVDKCAEKGEVVSRVLAAFVARTMVFENSTQFCLDKDMSEDDIDHLINLTVERLLEKDNPSLETIKTQVGFDQCYIDSDEKVEKKRQIWEDRVKRIQTDILSVAPKGTNDYDSLILLYRQIFSYLMIYYDEQANRTAEKEIVAAMESVFPRVGLKNFVEMSEGDKLSQLSELASIVYGIRLYNKMCGQGGAGIENVRDLALRESIDTMNTINAEIQEVKDLAGKYSEVLTFIHYHKDEPAKEEQEIRWKDELTNVRQYLSYLESLLDDISEITTKITSYSENWKDELNSLKDLIGSRTSVPKEQVYPKFSNLSLIWNTIQAARERLNARIEALTELRKWKNTYTRTLPGDILKRARIIGLPDEETINKDAESINQSEAPPDEPVDQSLTTRLVLQNTPEFLQLPLALDGYCPWTLYHRHGILIPGIPELGVIQYKSGLYVFSNTEAITAFQSNPQKYIDGVLECARKNPELIQLLNLGSYFPKVALSNFVSKSNGVHPLLAEPPPKMVDAATETPVHFVEKYIDYQYEWNEWNLRRKALQMLKLQKCKTIGSQTTRSAFKRVAQTQVWPPREHDTQTMVDDGTNPIMQKNYIIGLRGNPNNVSKTVVYRHEYK